GMVANIKGLKSHTIIEQGLEVLNNLEHRGAECCDPETGDGSGIMFQTPDAFFRKIAPSLGFELPAVGQYGVGMVFLPPEDKACTDCQTIIQETVEAEGQEFLGWRDVPVNPDSIGWLAQSRMPVIRQFFVGCGDNAIDSGVLERKLFVIRRVIEQTAFERRLGDGENFYLCSLSVNRIVYKGLIKSSQIPSFYLDIQDDDVTSAFAMVHSRFSTNTLGAWPLAHPYRMICHNGEINTLRGNINFMHARSALFESEDFGEDIKKLLPIIGDGQSDTASLDNALELLYHTGRSLPHAMLMLIPEAWGDHIPMNQAKRDFYEYHSSLMEPWDGPAMVSFTDGNNIGAILDRNGLRPMRYLVTNDDLLVMASETGVLDVPPEEVRFKSRLQPGCMFYVDFEQGRIVEDDEIKDSLASRQPYDQWLKDNVVDLEDLPEPKQVHGIELDTLVERQRAFGYTQEELQILLLPMGESGAEPIGSMGNDAALAILSDRPQPLFNYFKQLFAQVTNPPLDAIREELVTSVATFIGSEQNLFGETPLHARQLRLKEPLLTNEELERIRAADLPGVKAITISTLFAANSGIGGLKDAVELVRKQASQAIKDGCTILVLSDRGVDVDHVPIPSLLAVSALHHHLIREGTRVKVGIVLESGEPRETHHFAALIGYGAGAVNPYLALETIAGLVSDFRINSGLTIEQAQTNYFKALHKGVVKVMSKMGISTVQSYRGAQVFEAIGLSQSLVDEYFTWTPSRIGGLTIESLEEEVLRRHRHAYPEHRPAGGQELENPGAYYWRRNGEDHMWNPDSISKLQHASRLNSKKLYDEFAVLSNDEALHHKTLRGLLTLKPGDQLVSIDEVEPVEEILKRFATGGISLGSISREAHEALAIAMNRIGGRSNTGEGGEDPSRYKLDANGDSRNSAIKQVASGRFGVTTEYLVNAKDLQIKIAQGAKPGEGGQLPGHKVSDYIGNIRHTTPGVELISPPPHHDIYSIEDIAQLIHDLKTANQDARIHVKLVAETGVGTVAAGVAKAKADVVLISGDSGGTGASPESSIKHAGVAWELGLAETQQVLVANDLRSRIVVQTDGQIKTGRDVAIAAILGADEFGVATAALITLGCIYLRKCHLNLCSVGIATQDEELRKHFAGDPDYVVNYFRFMAEDLRQVMADMGFRTVNEMIGRTDRLDWSGVEEHWKAKGLNLDAMLYRAEVAPRMGAGSGTYQSEGQDHQLEEALDLQLIQQAKTALERRTPVEIEADVSNNHRAAGAMLSGEVAKRYGDEGLPQDTIKVKLNGSAGQSFGAFLSRGITFTLEGDSNDYLGKGLCGGRIIVRPPAKATFTPEENIIVGNVLLYGATGGDIYVRGLAGERFGVRNSGANAVVEGVGDHGCEYMTGGRVVVLGTTGRNFAAGMSGGIAYVYDEAGDFASRCNLDMVELGAVEEQSDMATLRLLIEAHSQHTSSAKARMVLDAWDSVIQKFVRVMPMAYKAILEQERKQSASSSAVANG
ncbi:MAG: glutamate synthase large subunit, partial [Chloroflexota bacterium]|nr:glutamate synthase large subunit [Chloroflexota bacterium]